MQKLKLLQRFFRYFFKADTLYQIHSPFVYKFVEEVLEDDREYYSFKSVEQLRHLLHGNHTKIKHLKDFGAGSHAGPLKEKSISSIAKNAASQKWQCQTLFRLINYFKPKTMLELGTSLGISTIYQASASMNAEFISLEGDPQLAKLARFNLEELNIKNVKVKVGRFKDTLSPALQKLKQLDYIFIDGNHRLAPTLEYFEKALPFAHNQTIFIFDDIHWSEEMEAAWEKLKAHPEVNLTIDLFHMGIVFLRKENKEKEHFILAPLSWKPWATWKVF